MDEFQRLPVDLVGLLVLCLFLLGSVLLIVAGGARLPVRWWASALVSGLIVAGASIFVVLAVSALDTGDPAGVEIRTWVAIAAAGALGFLAGTDVQLLIGMLRRTQGGTATAVAGALLGPVALIGGFLLLLRLQGTLV